jgi:hypothetical protein
MGLINGITLKGGIDLSNSYVNIKSYSFLKKEKIMLIDLNFYKSKDDYDNGADTVRDSIQFIVKDDLFDTYFSDSVLCSENVSPLSQCYKYLLTLSEFQGFQSS